MYCRNCQTMIHTFESIEVDENGKLVKGEQPTLCVACAGIAWENQRREAMRQMLVKEPNYINRRDLGNMRELAFRGKRNIVFFEKF